MRSGVGMSGGSNHSPFCSYHSHGPPSPPPSRAPGAWVVDCGHVRKVTTTSVGGPIDNRREEGPNPRSSGRSSY